MRQKKTSTPHGATAWQCNRIVSALAIPAGIIILVLFVQWQRYFRLNPIAYTDNPFVVAALISYIVLMVGFNMMSLNTIINDYVRGLWFVRICQIGLGVLCVVLPLASIGLLLMRYVL
ncbi:MAG: hypothetical protein H6849_04170 [Alphaproteobacteria bacterium]|nr:MAG: hypothetical protein H6849_04170 [Alphaproteobacteria bacterium]